MLKTALIFGNNMVLQRGKNITVWGTAAPAARITVSVQDKSSETAAEEDGLWQVILSPLHTSFEETMTITSSEGEKIQYTGVQVGEVWLAGGQSNMEFHMRYDADFDHEKEICTNDSLRYFDYPEVSYPKQTEEADYSKNYGFWRKAAPDQLERFSAVAYYFAKELQKKYRIPVGIIGCNWGGTPACAWMTREGIEEGGGRIWLDEYESAVQNLDLAAYEKDYKSNPMSYNTDILANSFFDFMMYGCSAEELAGKLSEMGIPDFTPVIGPYYERRPGGLYESMLRPVAPFGIRGFIWYQGETDGDCHPEIYHTLFPSLICDWRRLWSEELPFLFVQIAPLDQWMQCIGEPYAMIRDAQQHTVDSVAGTGMAVITDAGMQHDIHPKKKQPVGYRLALLAENKVYGDDILCEAPTLISAEQKTGELTLTFDNAGDGLELRDTVPHGQFVGRNCLGGLQIIQNGRELNAALLSASVSGNKVIVSGPEINGSAETKIRLARTGWYLVNLYNSAGIPARPAEITVTISGV